MELRASVAGYAFNLAQFDALRRQVDALDPASNRLSGVPGPLRAPPLDLRPQATPERRAGLAERGIAALRAGQVGVLVLNGGMATRFGGGAKGVVPVLEGHPRCSFLGIKLAEVSRQAMRLAARIPAVVMNSFATSEVSLAHLRAIAWGGVPLDDRYVFDQSVMPRVLPDGTPLSSLAGADAAPDTLVYAAPGHGDTLVRLRESGVLAKLRARGVEHLLVSNVDNVGATLDPVILGAHLEGVAHGSAVTVEVVGRLQGDAGGCVAVPPGSDHPAIIEAFRLPAGVDLATYPHFNTNTLWLALDAVDREFPLAWFSVQKTIKWPDAPGSLEIIQFERLIGQVTEFVVSNFVEVDRAERFLPIKTRDDLAAAHAKLQASAHAAGLLD